MNPSGASGTGGLVAAEVRSTVGRLAFLAAASEVLASSLDLSETLTQVVHLAVPELADICSIELLHDGRLELVAIADSDPTAEPMLRSHASQARYADDPAYPPRRVVESGRPVLVPEVPADVYQRFAKEQDQLDFLVRRRAGTGMSVPLQARGHILGSMSFARLAGKAAYDENDLFLAVDLGHRAALAIDSAQQFAAAAAEVDARRRSEEVQSFLAEVTRALIAEFDYESNLRTLARLVVPFLADICLIDVPDGAGIHRLAASHRDPDGQALVDELGRRFPPDPGGEHPAVRALRSGETTYAPHMSEEFLLATTRDDEHYRIVCQLGFASYICVPLVARGHVLGAFTLVSCSPDRRFTIDDVHLVEDVVARASLVVDNARLLAERTHVAAVLQRSLLPAALPEIPGIDLAARYRAVGEGIEVGGDFYDVLHAGDDRWVLAVGDVSGKGADAAALTGLIRHSLGALARLTPDAQPILRAVHEILLAETGADDRYCTMVCAVLRPDAGGASLSVVCAGHPPPLVRRHDGSVVEVPCRGVLLGAFAETVVPEPTIVRLHEGDTAIFYTDGVTEARHGEGIFGEARLHAALEASSGDARALADAIVAAVDDYADGEQRDDIAVLAVGVQRRA